MSNTTQLPVTPKQERANAKPSETDEPTPRLPITSPEQAIEVAKILRQADPGKTEVAKYGRRFQLMHLHIFFLASHDARKKKMRTIDYTYKHQTLMMAYNFQDDPRYQEIARRGFKPYMFLAKEKQDLIDFSSKSDDLRVKAQCIRAFRFVHCLEECLQNPIFTQSTLEFMILNQHLQLRDHFEAAHGFTRMSANVQMLYWDLLGWGFDYLSPRIDNYLCIRAPGKQYANDKKFFLARKEYYMSLEFESTQTALVGYCYHIFSIYIEQSPQKEANLMLTVFGEIRKLKAKLQGNAKEMNETAAKKLQNAEYELFCKVFELNQWKAFF